MNRDKEIDNFILLIEGIIKRPGMFQINSVKELGILILGYTMALEKHKKIQVLTFLNEFNSFINEHFKTNNEYRWDKLIHFYSGSDSNSLSMFKELFDKYVVSPTAARMKSGRR